MYEFDGCISVSQTYPVCIKPSTTLEHVLKIFVSSNIRHIPVVQSMDDGEKKKIGVGKVVSIRDVLCAVVKHVNGYLSP